MELVDQARRRFWWNEILAQGAWALSAGTGALVLLLLLGTQILDWHWLVLLPVGTFGLGAYRTIRRLPSAYAVAQIIDGRLKLADSLSTAVHFEAHPQGVSPVIREMQRLRAERLCETVSVTRAIPYTMPRAVYALGVLLLTATSLFALRYAMERRLELRRPMARILQHALGLDVQLVAAAEEKKKPAPKRSPLEEMAGLSLPASDQKPPGPLQPTDSVLDASARNEAQKQNAAQQSQTQKLNAGEPSESDDPESEATDSAGLSTGKDNGSEGQQGPSMQKQPGQQGNQGAQDGAPGNNSSLLAKFKDAMQNLLSRMKQQPGGANGGQPQMAQNQNGRQGTPQQGGNSQGGKQGKQQSGQEGESQEGQSGQDAQMAQNAQGRGSGKNGEEQSSNQPGSGIGKQDGNKDTKLAEQLAAMGKLSEIIGKRSANVSGEVTVEVQTSSQQLQTPYAQRNAAHGETTAEISRDEVPVALQAYVQQYFEQVRKQVPPARARN